MAIVACICAMASASAAATAASMSARRRAWADPGPHHQDNCPRYQPFWQPSDEQSEKEEQ